MHEARTSLAVVGTLVLVGCGGGAPSQSIQLTPTVGTSSVMECLGQETQKLGYKVLMMDREDGNMVAERRDSKPDIGQPREYAGGDQLKVGRLKKQGDVQPLSITPSSFSSHARTPAGPIASRPPSASDTCQAGSKCQ